MVRYIAPFGVWRRSLTTVTAEKLKVGRFYCFATVRVRALRSGRGARTRLCGRGAASAVGRRNTASVQELGSCLAIEHGEEVGAWPTGVGHRRSGLSVCVRGHARHAHSIHSERIERREN